MNTKILQKVLDELKKDTPSHDYIRGLVETLVDIEYPINTPVVSPVTDNFYTKSVNTVSADNLLTDEDIDYGRKMLGGPIGRVN